MEIVLKNSAFSEVQCNIAGIHKVIVQALRCYLVLQI